LRYDLAMTYLNELWSYLLISAPYLIFGLTISGFIHQFINAKTIKKHLGDGGIKSIIKASLVGVPLPLCSCSVIPTSITLKQSGASNASTSSFLISTPETGVDSISLTYAIIDLPMAIIRPIAAFISSFTAGIFQHIWNRGDVMVESAIEEATKSCCASKKEEKKKSGVALVKESFGYGFGKLSDDISLWLTFGILAGALINVIVPDDFFLNLADWQGRGMILLVGIPLYICASATTPIAASLMLKGMSPGAALLLLMVGPATNISNIAVLQKYIGKKGVFLNILAIIISGLALSYIVDWIYAEFIVSTIKLKGHHHHHEAAAWWEIASAIILIPLLLKGIYKEEIKPRLKKAKAQSHESSCH
jgi:uncharacterized membrane protein YraQ (UPF0718 family)